jgi:hypothetical protein
MARPKKDTIDYFPHPVKNGSKMFIMEQTYGDKGYMSYYKLLEFLGAAEGHFLDFSNDKHRLYFCAAIKADNDLMNKIIGTLVEIGAVNKHLWESKKIIWCQDLIDSVSDLYRKRNRNIPSAPIIDNNNPVIDVENPQSIVKESKVNEIKVNDIQNRKLKFSETLKPYIQIYGRDMLLDFFYYWTEENKSKTKFRQELQNTWNLEGRLRNWSKNDKNFKNGSGKNNHNSNKANLNELDQQLTSFLGSNISNNN